MNNQDKLGQDLDSLIEQIQQIGGSKTLENINKGITAVGLLKTKLNLLRQMGVNTSNAEDKLSNVERDLLTAQNVLSNNQ